MAYYIRGDVPNYLEEALTEVARTDNCESPSISSKKRKKSTETDRKTQSTDELAQKFFKEYEKMAEEGNTEALFRMGLLYRHGEGTEKSDENAFICFKRAAKLGNSKAQLEVAKMYDSGIGIDRSLEKALPYYKKAAESGMEEAIQVLAIINGKFFKAQNETVLTKKQKDENFKAMKKKADQENDPEALGEVGYMYEFGHGTKQSLVKSFEYYKKSADLGEFRAQRQVGNMYRKGEGVKQSHQMAYKYYELAVNGSAIEAEKRKAKKDRDSLIKEHYPDYDKLLAKQQDPKALLALVKIHQKIGGRHISATTMDLCRQAANEPNNDRDAQFELANMLDSSPFQWSKKEAYSYYKKAADQGHRKAKIILASKVAPKEK